MGKKEKSKNKESGSDNFAQKSSKKGRAKKKECVDRNEDDIDIILEQIAQEEARQKQKVEKEPLEEIIDYPPSDRIYFSLTAHPFKNELILFGGELDDQVTIHTYDDLFLYNLDKSHWTLVKTAEGPCPRCAHAAVCVPQNQGELWIFGGQYFSQAEAEYYYLRDLWVFHLNEKKWQKIVSPNSPLARGGHRMVQIKKQLFVFGGMYNNQDDYKYLNDVHSFNLVNYTWTKIETFGIPPSPRSDYIMLQTPDNKILLYGGYSRKYTRKNYSMAHICEDMFVLENDDSKWTWRLIEQKGDKPSARCNASATIAQPGLAYVFGGLFDLSDEYKGTFFNDLFSLNLHTFEWRRVSPDGSVKTAIRRKKKKGRKDLSQTNDNAKETVESTGTPKCKTENEKVVTNFFLPSARLGSGLIVKQNVLYLYGGLYHDNDESFLYTLGDFYSLDLRKLDRWKVIFHWSSRSQENTKSTECTESECLNDNDIDNLDFDFNEDEFNHALMNLKINRVNSDESKITDK